MAFEHNHCLVGRVAFGDSAQVQLHTRLCQLHGARVFFESNVLEAYKFARLGEAFGVRQLVLAPCSSPN